MAVDIVATVGASNANSFVTPEEMTAYCDGRLNAGIWTEAEEQLPALVEATRDLTVLQWLGERASATQALAWPRAYCPDPDLEGTVDGLVVDLVVRRWPVVFPADIIPERVRVATCELALQYLKAGGTDLAVVSADDGVKRKKVGPLETEWRDAHTRRTGTAALTRVWANVRPLLRAGGGSLTLRRV
jgi:hypothetical protein